MSTTELRRAGVLARVEPGTLQLGSAARLMEVSYRQAKRLYRRDRAEGAKGLKHRSGGRVSNRATDAPDAIRPHVRGAGHQDHPAEFAAGTTGGRSPTTAHQPGDF
jgi:hypothetical protein